MKRDLLLKLWVFVFLAVFSAKTFGQLTPVASTGLPNIGRGVTAAADFDKDGKLDLIVIGQNGDFQTISTAFPGILGIYKGNGDGTFTDKTADWLPSGANALPAVGGAIIGVADYDNDGYPDFCYAGRTAAGTNIVRLLKNNNGTGFTDVTSTAFATAPTGTYTGSIEWADVDNDGDLDLLIQGRTYTSLAYPGSSGARGNTTQLYKNSGGFFTSSPIPGMAVCFGQAKFCDFDNDGDPDILYYGGGNIGGQMVNDGTGTFTQSGYTGTAMAVRGSNMAFADLNGDGKIDYLQSYISSSSTPAPGFKLGINTSASAGSVSFTTTTSGFTVFGTTTNTNVGTIACVDYNNDGKMDYSIHGLVGTTPTTTLFLNNGGATPTFTASTEVLTGLHYGNEIWADFNNDGKPDLLINGYSDAAGSVPATILYLNGGSANAAPIAPQSLSSTVTNNNVALSWSMPANSDDITPNASLTYRYYLRTGINQYYAGYSSSGPLVIPTQGMINIPTYTVKNLPGGTYYWSVQAVDGAYNGGAWATESSFSIPTVTPSTQASALAFANTTTTGTDITWTNGNGYKRIVFISENTSGSPTLAEGQSFTANPVYGQGSTAGTGWYCVYNGNGSKVTVSGLTEKTNYKVVVYEYDGIPGFEKYSTSESTANAGTVLTPFTITTQASSIVVLAASYSFDVSWTNGNGAKRAVFISLGNTGTPTINDGQTYTANAAFGQGSAAGTGWYCVYNGTGSSITITGLSINTQYILAVYEYNGDPGKERYLTTAATDNPFSKFTSNKLNQIITFDPLVSKTTMDAPFALSATGGDSGNPIVYTSSNTSVATISGNTVTIVGAGTTDITATQAGNTGFSDATPVTRTLTVNKVAQAINFDALPTNIKYLDPAFQVSATGGASGNSVVFTSSDPTKATVSGTTVTIVGAGSVDIIANQAGNAIYADAPEVRKTLTIAKLPQAIGFDNLSNKTYLNAPFTLTATGGDSGNPVTFTASSGIVSITGSTCTILGAGTVTITADQAGNNNYSAAPSVPRTLTIAKAAQSITFDLLPSKNANDGTFTLTATASSGLPVTYTSSDPLVASISGNVVTIKKAGTITITAAQAGDVNFNAAGSVIRGLVVNKLSQTLTFDALATKLPSEADFQLMATVTSGRKITYTSSNPNVATITGDNKDYVHIVANGTTFITASQPGDSIYLAAVPVQRVFMVGTTGVKELSEKEVSIFPNPVSETINVNFAKPMAQTTISIYSYNGQQVTSVNADQTANVIYMGNLAKGTYVLKIVSPDGTLVKQIIKK